MDERFRGNNYIWKEHNIFVQARILGRELTLRTTA